MNQPHNNQDRPEICVTQAHARYYAVGIILLLSVSFITGYYWGKKRAYEEFLGGCAEEALGDKISAALCSLYDSSSDEQKEIDLDENGSGDHKEEAVNPADSQNGTNGEVAGAEGVRANGAQASAEVDPVLYYAQLAGFGSKVMAEKYKNTLKKREITAHVIARTSKTTKGVVCTWYQVVTDPMGYDQLQTLVDSIKKADKLYGVVLVEQTKETIEEGY